MQKCKPGDCLECHWYPDKKSMGILWKQSFDFFKEITIENSCLKIKNANGIVISFAFVSWNFCNLFSLSVYNKSYDRKNK